MSPSPMNLAVAAAAASGADDRLLVPLAVVGVVLGAVLLAVGAGTRRHGDPDDRSAR